MSSEIAASVEAKAPEHDAPETAIAPTMHSVLRKALVALSLLAVDGLVPQNPKAKRARRSPKPRRARLSERTIVPCPPRGNGCLLLAGSWAQD